jgi:biopolymer transport protein ExbD
MKLELTLPERPGFLHATPALDLFLLLLLFFAVAPALVLQSGLTVELPPSKFQIERDQDLLVVTLGAGQQAANIHFGRKSVTFGQLEEIFERMRQDGSAARSQVLLQTAADLPVRTERKVAEMIVGKGFRLALVGQGPNRLLPQDERSGSPPDEP